MSELRSAIDALSADDLHALVAGQLLDRTAELVQSINRLNSELIRTVRHADVVLLDAENVPDALVRAPRRSLVLAGGRTVVRDGELVL